MGRGLDERSLSQGLDVGCRNTKEEDTRKHPGEEIKPDVPVAAAAPSPPPQQPENGGNAEKKKDTQSRKDSETELVNYADKAVGNINGHISTLQQNLTRFESSIKEVKESELLQPEGAPSIPSAGELSQVTSSQQTETAHPEPAPHIEPSSPEELKKSAEFVDIRTKQTYQRRVQVRDSQKIEEDEAGALAARQLAEEVVFRGVRKIIRAIRNFAFRRKINERVAMKKRGAELVRKMQENTCVIPRPAPSKSQSATTGAKPVPKVVKDKEGGFQNRLKETAGKLRVKKRFCQMYNRQVLVWARAMLADCKTKLGKGKQMHPSI